VFDFRSKVREVATEVVLRLFGVLMAALLALSGAGFCAASLYLWLETRLPDFVAALVVGGALVLAAAIVLWIVSARRGGAAAEPAPAAAAEPPDDLKLVLRAVEDVLPAVRRAPFRSMLLALAAGIGVGLVRENVRRSDRDKS
jgi:hypothetical protein